jgi:hypothetical protein
MRELCFLGTTDIMKLVEFTGYSVDFVAAIASNMIWNNLWRESGDLSTENPHWFSPTELVADGAFWEDVEVACGWAWMPGIQPLKIEDPCSIYKNKRHIDFCGHSSLPI